MSWLSGFAEKAEGLLNQLDQSAATALHTKQKAGLSKQSYNLSGELVQHGSSSALGNLGSSHHRSSSHTGATDTDTAKAVSQKRDDSLLSKTTAAFDSSNKEEKLIEYLNTSDGAPSQSHESARGGAATTTLSRRSSASSLRSLPVHALYAYGQAEESINNASVSADTKLKEISAGFTANNADGQRQLWELTARVADLQKAVSSKDSEVAVLRIRLQDVETLLQLKAQSLKQLEEERLRLLKDVENYRQSSDGSTVSASLQIKVAELEEILKRERRSFKKSEADWHDRLSKLEDERSSLTQELMTAQRNLTEEKLKAKDVVDQLKLAKYNLEANKQEFDEYKQKAQRILQSKEKVIGTLKEGVNVQNEPSVQSVELEELRQERDLLREELQHQHLLLYDLKAELHEVESQLAAEQRAHLESQRYLQEQAQRYQQSASEYREQAEKLKQEYQFLQDDMRRQYVSLQVKLQEKDAEIDRMTKQLASRSLASVTDDEMTTRMRALADNLIGKQTVIESLQSERNALRMQVERLERLYREAESAAVLSSSTTINMSSIEDGHQLQARVPNFLRESPFDSGVTLGVKRAYSSLDKLSIRMGLFLRRYPIARVLIFVYIFLLHFWVLIVLLTYTPEIHGQELAGHK